MITIDKENKLSTYGVKAYTISYGTSYDRWIYFIQNHDLPMPFNNIIRVYDKAIEQSDLIFNISLRVKNVNRNKQIFEHDNIQHEVIKIEKRKLKNVSVFN